MRARRMLLTVTTSVSVLVLAGALAQSAAALEYEPIVWNSTEWCLDDPGYNSSNGVQLDIWKCNYGSNQLFAWEPSHSKADWYLIRLGDNHSKCLADPWDSTKNGEKLEVYTCKDEPAFWWTPQNTVEGTNSVDICFENWNELVFGNNSGVEKNGNPVVMWQYFGGPDQSWAYAGWNPH
jgi:hypothetical protein